MLSCLSTSKLTLLFHVLSTSVRFALNVHSLTLAGSVSAPLFFTSSEIAASRAQIIADANEMEVLQHEGVMSRMLKW